MGSARGEATGRHPLAVSRGRVGPIPWITGDVLPILSGAQAEAEGARSGGSDRIWLRVRHAEVRRAAVGSIGSCGLHCQESRHICFGWLRSASLFGRVMGPREDRPGPVSLRFRPPLGSHRDGIGSRHRREQPRVRHFYYPLGPDAVLLSARIKATVAAATSPSVHARRLGIPCHFRGGSPTCNAIGSSCPSWP